MAASAKNAQRAGGNLCSRTSKATILQKPTAYRKSARRSWVQVKIECLRMLSTCCRGIRALECNNLAPRQRRAHHRAKDWQRQALQTVLESGGCCGLSGGNQVSGHHYREREDIRITLSILCLTNREIANGMGGGGFEMNSTKIPSTVYMSIMLYNIFFSRGGRGTSLATIMY